MSDKDFKVKNKLQVKGITSAGPVVSDASGNLDSTSYIATQYGGTGTTQSPASGQILYSASGTTYSPTDLSSIAAPSASPTFTGNVVLPSTTTYSGTNIQTLLDAKSNKTKTLSTKIADYTLTTADNNTIIEFNSSSDLNLTLPTYSNAAFSYGDNFSIVNRGSGKVNILNQSGTSALSSYSMTGLGSSIYTAFYANGIYIAQSGAGYYRSTDAITWTIISGISIGSTSALYNQRIVYGAGLYLLSASTGIWSSSNGTTWTQRLSGTNTIYSIKYANNKFMAGSVNGLMYTSTDGITWTSLGTVASLGPGATITSIEYVSSIGTWFATYAFSPYLIKSTDNGATWTQITGNSGMRSLATNGSILIGNYPSTATSTFYTTTDGVTLTARSLPLTGYSGKIIWDGTQFVMGYTNNTSPYTLYQYTSTDGINWSVQSSVSAISNSAPNGLLVGASGQYVYLGHFTTAYTSGSVTTSYISKNNGSYLLPKSRAEIYIYNQNQFVVSGDLGIENSVSSNITLVSGNNYYVDTTSARTLTLPASPSTGDEIHIFDASNNALTNNITVQPNSSKIQGSVQNLIIDSNAAAAYLVYTGSTYGWMVN